ncbi:MAG: hypothetical protein ACRDZX_02355 [Acidimicrobiales bacterium]
MSDSPLSGTSPVGVVSPHLDDAAFSCGHLLGDHAGSHVLTVFSAGGPLDGWVPEWEARSGMFRPGDDVMAARRAEDEKALTAAGAVAHHLGFVDAQYREGPPPRHPRLRPWAQRAARARARGPGLVPAISQRLGAEVSGLDIETWCVPLGLWHVDHHLVAAACRELALALPERHWVVYEDLPYALRLPSSDVVAAHRLYSDRGLGLRALGFEPATRAGRKRELLSIYRSQLGPLGEGVGQAVAGPEKYFLVTR